MGGPACIQPATVKPVARDFAFGRLEQLVDVVAGRQVAQQLRRQARSNGRQVSRAGRGGRLSASRNADEETNEEGEAPRPGPTSSTCHVRGILTQIRTGLDRVLDAIRQGAGRDQIGCWTRPDNVLSAIT